jgi:hypothetical protein
MTNDELRKLLAERPTLSLWPEAGQALGLKRNQVYACAINGDIATIQFGRLKRVPSAWLRQKLGL